MKKILLLGAFDRYNYGDNLMPLLFKMYVDKYAKEILADYVFEYTSISDSDLGKYCCLPTTSINKFTCDKSVCAVIVIGGEVLCAKNSGLFLHMQENNASHLILKYLSKILRSAFSLYSDRKYSAKWEFPYIPETNFFDTKPKVIFNTVGGGISHLKNKHKNMVSARLESSNYVSVRDVRTMEEVNKFRNAETVLSPDSAYIMSDIITDEFLNENVSEKIKNSTNSDYIVIQAAPSKLGASKEHLISQIKKISSSLKVKVVLLPIGYASGHDDFKLLKEVNEAVFEDTVLFYDLNVWEIMSVIKNAQVFFGTSLHGVITAMSFGVPHFGLNKSIKKLDSFLKDWSVPPFNRCYDVADIENLISLYSHDDITVLKQRTDEIIALVKANNDKMLNVITRT